MAEMIPFSIDDIKKVAGNILDFFNYNNVESLRELENFLYKESMIDEEKLEYIYLDMRPSESNTTAHTLTYVIEGKGIPVEIRMNEPMNRSKIIVKGDFLLPDYKLLAFQNFDEYINFVQDKEIFYADIPEIKRELDDLRKRKDVC